jgi:hypothetical protein
MEYYNIRNRDMGRNDVWDMSRDDVWDMSRDDVCCGYCGERNHTHSECKHRTHIQCDSCHEYGHKAKMCKVHGHGDSSIKYKILDLDKGKVVRKVAAATVGQVKVRKRKRHRILI